MSLPFDAPRVDTRALSRARLASLSASIVVGAIGALVLIGWICAIDSLKSVYGPITMKTNAALGLLLCAIALGCSLIGFRLVGTACAALASTLGALTLSQHLFGWDLGIDQLLFVEQAGAAATASPNRMGPNASTSLTLAGIAVILLFRRTTRAVAYAQRLAFTGVVLETLAIAGYFYGAVELYAIARYTGIALHTAVALLALNIGILTARVDAGPMAVFGGDGPGGTLLRRVSAPIVLIPFGLGYLVLEARQADVVDRGLGFALFAGALVVLLGATVWHTARVLEASDHRRRRAERDRDMLLLRERNARDEAEQASRLKDQFIAVISHELRTPLNVMLGWTRVLESGTTADRHAHAAAVVARNGRLLARLVEDLLDISRVSAGQFEISPAPIAFNPVVQASIEALAPAAAERQVQLVGSLDPADATINGDAERLQQIVSNLISNGVKFTGPGGRVDVRTVVTSRGVTLSVSDTGVGFDDAFTSQLFTPFRQADSSSKREHGGLGLGLSIAKHIVELHGGTIAGTSDGPGKGARFVVTLPSLGAPAIPASGTAADDFELRV